MNESNTAASQKYEIDFKKWLVWLFIRSVRCVYLMLLRTLATLCLY